MMLLGFVVAMVGAIMVVIVWESSVEILRRYDEGKVRLSHKDLCLIPVKVKILVVLGGLVLIVGVITYFLGYVLK